MTSVVSEVMGPEFYKLHPKVQWRFGFGAQDKVAQFGTGVMESISHSKLLPPPALWLGGKRKMVPSDSGTDIPFTIANYAYVDDLGRETLAFVRRFQFPGHEVSLDSVMVVGRRGALDYIGAGPDMVVHTTCSADADGGLRLDSGLPRFLAPRGSIKPPSLLSAETRGREWWDEQEQRHRIDIEVRGRTLGQLFRYTGWFTATQETCEITDLPDELGPGRTDPRE
ncbi:MAG: DUF4166 domain-containing protein [Rhodococcus sp. (in: high G+C Gram-positive bacteria)]